MFVFISLSVFSNILILFIFIFLFRFSCFTALDIFLINELKANLLSCWLRGVLGISSKSFSLLISLLSTLIFRFSSVFFLLFKTSIIFLEISFKFSFSWLLSVFLIVSIIFMGIISNDIFSFWLI